VALTSRGVGTHRGQRTTGGCCRKVLCGYHQRGSESAFVGPPKKKLAFLSRLSDKLVGERDHTYRLEDDESLQIQLSGEFDKLGKKVGHEMRRFGMGMRRRRGKK